MLGTFFLAMGLFALLYAGGQEAYRRARELGGPSTPLATRARELPRADAPSSFLPTSAPAPVQHTPSRPSLVFTPHPTRSVAWRSTIERIVIPTVGVDSPVVPVGWHLEEIGGQPVAVWDVAPFAVGHHEGSGNPGEGTNIVLAGHVAGKAGDVFRRLIELEPGDAVLLYAKGKPYPYWVEQVLLVPETTVSLGQRLQNARYMAPTKEEVLTLITCWPIGVYDQRVIVLARPAWATPVHRPERWQE